MIARVTRRRDVARVDERVRRPAVDALAVWGPVVLLAYLTVVATYFVIRPGSRWAESDSVGQGLAIRSILGSGALMPATGVLTSGDSGWQAAVSTADTYSASPEPTFYPNGYAYASVSTAIVHFTGLDVAQLLQLVYPLVSAALVFPAWALYRELTGSHRGALVATLLLSLNPEFLFVVLRGSHERVLRTLMLVSLWLLIRSFRYRDRPGHFVAHVVLFYLTSYALIATNALFGISFVLAIATAMAMAWALGRARPGLLTLASTVAARLTLVTLAVTAVGLVFIFYLYRPAIHSLEVLDGVGAKIVSLFVTTESASNPYTQVVSGWTSLQVYFLLSLGTYLLLGGSALIWVWQGVTWILGFRRPTTLTAWLLWLTYGAFAAQGVLAILSDRSGLLSGNVQHRSFPSFAIAAAPVVAVALVGWRPRIWQRVAVAGFIGLLAGFSLLKASNEPALSNKWTFYTVPELQGLIWADRHHRDATIWVGLDERLSTAFEFVMGDSKRGNRWNVYLPRRDEAHSFLVSDVTRLQSSRFNKPLPRVEYDNLVFDLENRVYDNGSVQLYRKRSRSPYQR